MDAAKEPVELLPASEDLHSSIAGDSLFGATAKFGDRVMMLDDAAALAVELTGFSQAFIFIDCEGDLKLHGLWHDTGKASLSEALVDGLLEHGPEHLETEFRNGTLLWKDIVDGSSKVIGKFALADTQPNVGLAVSERVFDHLLRQITLVIELYLEEIAISRTLRRYEQIVQLMEPLAEIDAHRRFVFVNPAFERLVGYTAQELLGRTYLEITPEKWHAEEAEQVKDHYKRRGFTAHYQKEYQHKNGKIFPIELSGFSLPGETNTFGIVRDISDRVAREEELKHRGEYLHMLAERLSLATEVSGSGVWEFDYATATLNWHESAYRLLDLLPDDDRTPDQIIEEMADPGEGERLRQLIETLGKNDWLYDEIAFTLANGKRKIMRVRAKVYRDDAGQPVRLLGVSSDITAQKASEEALNASERRLTSVVQNAPNVAIQFYDSDGIVHLWNDASTSLFGFTSEEMIGNTLLDKIHNAEQYEAFKAALTQIKRTGKADGPSPCNFIRRDGSEGTCLSTMFEIPGPAGEPWFACMDVDITDQISVTKQLRELTENLDKIVQERTAELAEKNKDLEEFSYVVSHDLRGPLRAIVGFSQIINDVYGNELSGEAKELFERIKVNATRMSDMLEGILTYSRIGSRKGTYSKISLSKLVQDVVEPIRSQFASSSIEYMVQVDECEVTTDADALTISLRNIIHNAAKFSRSSEHPRVEIRAEVIGNTCSIHITDNGPGFDMAHAKSLFKMFQILEVNENAGTGIGLALVARAVSRIRGHVSFQSSPGNGATFTIAIPIKPRRKDA
jgi:PAS domain S-box-containing protein